METIVFSPNVYASNCPTRQVLDLIADRWTALVIGLLEDQPKRFSELQRGIGGISQKMLSQTLRELERSGMVTRTVYPEIPPRVEYALTPLGKTICAPLAAIRNWAEENIEQISSSQEDYDNRTSSRAVAVQPDVQART
ncbi:MAG: helix-turn-helix transcriptional regulator [Anaerolineae bacterium]|nr:helix-turn-helix transcriptional regulator [Anaerolineae bacterium]